MKVAGGYTVPDTVELFFSPSNDTVDPGPVVRETPDVILVLRTPLDTCISWKDMLGSIPESLLGTTTSMKRLSVVDTAKEGEQNVDPVTLMVPRVVYTYDPSDPVRRTTLTVTGELCQKVHLPHIETLPSTEGLDMDRLNV